MAWMSEEEAASVLGVSFRTVRRRVGNGSLRSMRQGQQILVDIELSRISACGPSTPAKPVDSGLVLDSPQSNTAPICTAEIATPAPIETRPPSFSPPALGALGAGSLRWTSDYDAPTARNRIPSADPVPSRATAAVAWVLLTLLLFGGTLVAWARYHDHQQFERAQSQHQQAMSAAQRVLTETQQQLSAQQASAAEREARFNTELTGARARLDEATGELSRQRKDAAQLKSDLDQLTAHMTDAATQRHVMASELAGARTSLAAARVQSNITSALGELATALRGRWTAGPLQPMMPAQDEELPPTPDQPVGERSIPTQPPRLNGEETGGKLQPILAPRSK